ncbi:MAG: hypothetical protein KIT74_12345 [Fimbriimonadales bacterium]|nr:hypothetical protein [Fimbriimonadales bacterium]
MIVTALAGLALAAPFQLSSDPLLDKRVTYSTSTAPIREVLEELSAATGAKLRVVGAFSDDLVVLYVKDRPAHEVLSKIATHFDWQWTKDEAGYILGGKPGWETRYARGIDDSIYSLMKDAVQQAQKWCDEVRQMDLGAIKEKSKHVSAAIEELYSKLTDDERANEAIYAQLEVMEAELEKLQSLTDPAAMITNQLVSSLNQTTLLELARRSRLVFSVVPTASQKLLPPNATSAAHSLVATIIERNQMYESQADEYDSEYVPEKFTASDVYTVRVELTASLPQLISGGTWNPGANIAIVGKSGKVLWRGSHSYTSYGNAQHLEDLLTPIHEMEDYEQSESERLPRGPVDSLSAAFELDREFNAAIASSRMGSNEPPKELLESMAKGSKVDFLASIMRIGPMIAERAGVSFIADAYDYAGSMWEAFLPANTVGKMFDSFAHRVDGNWTYENKWVAIRSNNPELRRAGTIPRSTLRKYRDLTAEQIGLTIDQVAQLAAELTDFQLSSPALMTFASFEFFGGLSETASSYGLRAIAAMNPMERQAIRSGGARFGSLSPGVRNHIAEFLYRSGDEWSEIATLSEFDFMSEIDLDLSDEEIEKRFRDRYGSLWDSVESGDDREITQILPNGPTAETLIHADENHVEAIAANFMFAGITMPVSMPAEMYAMMKTMMDGAAGQVDFLPAIAIPTVRPAIGTRLTVKVTFLPEKSAAFGTVGMVAKPGTSFGPYDELPDSTKKRVSKMMEIQKRMFDRGGDGGGGHIPPPQQMP